MSTVTPGTAMNSEARKRAAEATAVQAADVARLRGQRAAAERGHIARLQQEVRDLRTRLDQVRAVHARWGVTDVEDLDVLDLWETLGRVLGSGAGQ